MKQHPCHKYPLLFPVHIYICFSAFPLQKNFVFKNITHHTMSASGGERVRGLMKIQALSAFDKAVRIKFG